MIRNQHLLCNLILLCIVTLLFGVVTASADPWWDSDWSWKQNVTIDYTQVDFQQTDFPVKVHMYIEGALNSNGSDIRILNGAENTQFAREIEYYNATSENLTFYVKIQSLSNTTNTTFWVYGGNAGVSEPAADSTYGRQAVWNSDYETVYLMNTEVYGSSFFDSTTNQKNATPVGFSTNVLTDADYGKQIYLDGGDYFTKPIDNIGSTWTLSFSAKRLDNNRLEHLCDQANDPNRLMVRINTATNMQYYDGGYSDLAYDPDDTDLHHYVLSQTGTSAKFYVDGDETASLSGLAGRNLGQYVMWFATSYNSGNPLASFYGYYDFMSIQSNADDFNTTKTKFNNINNPTATGANPFFASFGVFDYSGNTPPTLPTLISPLNNTYHLSYDDIILNASSTDHDNDTITYYFYGDSVNGSTYLGMNDTVNGTTFNWSVYQYGEYYWKVRAYDGYIFGNYSAIYQFTAIVPPNLTTPINTSTEYTTFPPLTSTKSFYWQDMSSPQYRIMVAEDEYFNVVAIDTHTGTNNSNQELLVNKQYFWKVYSYDGTTYSDSSDVWNFNLTGNSSLTGSAIEGVVYQANGDIAAIPGAEVTIWNTTWSSSMITGSNGYYVFEDLNSGTVYNLQAKSDRYWDSSIALVSAESDPVTNNFYLIDDLTDTEWWHYVEFTVQNVWGVTYPDVATNVYIGDSPTISESGNTESDGTISFHLNQNVQYHITFINSTLGINEDVTLYPVATSYTVYIDSYSFDLPDTVTDDIQAYIVSSRVNATHGYINFTWSDTSGLTSSINYYIHDVDGNELYNTSNSGPDMFNSQIVAATDDRYIVRYVGVHPTHGIIDKTETVIFHGGRRVDFGWPHDWQYAVTALAFLIFIGALFGAKTAHYGAITVVIFAWIFKWIGWLNETNTSTLLIILAAVIAFGWSLRKSEEVKM